MLVLPRKRTRRTLTDIPAHAPQLGHRLLTDLTNIKNGHTISTWDVNLDIDGAIKPRGGSRMRWNRPPGALQLARFDATEGWTKISGTGSFDYVNPALTFAGPVILEDLGPSDQALEATVTGGEFEDVIIRRSGLSLDLGKDLDEYICYWLKYSSNTDSLVYLRLGTSATDFFAFELAAGPPGGAVWTPYFVRKESAETVGAPDWTNITQMEIYVQGADLFSVRMAFDNLFIAPKWVDGLYNFERSFGAGGGSHIIAVARGGIYWFNEDFPKWVTLETGLVEYEPASFATLDDFCYVSKASDDMRMIRGEKSELNPGSTYLAGIKAPRSGAVLTVKPGQGALPGGVHAYRYVFYSEITGKESNSALSISAVTAEGTDAILHRSIPISHDPKVSHVRIYRKDGTMDRFRRVTSDPKGEVTNGSRSFTDNVAQADLPAIELEGHPTYDINSPPPKGSMLIDINNRLSVAGNIEQPGRVWNSRAGTGEQWDVNRTYHDIGHRVTAIADVDGFHLIGRPRGFKIGTPTEGTLMGFFYKDKFIASKNAGSGPISHNGLIVTKIGTFYRGRDGYYKLGQGWRPEVISEAWRGENTLPDLSGPVFSEMDSKAAEHSSAVFNEDRGQILWTERRPGKRVADIVAVYHVPEALGTQEQHPAQHAWSFHRYGYGNDLAGMSQFASYTDLSTGNSRILGAGPGGFIYDIDTRETSDVILSQRVAIQQSITWIHQFKGVALGDQHLKDIHHIDFLFFPLGNYPVTVTAHYDWGSRPVSVQTLTPIPEDDISVIADADIATAGPFYARAGVYRGMTLPALRCRSITVKMENLNVDEGFVLAGYTLWLKWISGQKHRN